MTQEENQNKETISPKENIRQARVQKLTDFVDKGINPYPYKYEKTASAAELQEKYKDLPAGEETEDEYAVAGRIMAMRNTGMFIDLMDETGKIQIFSHKQNLGEEKFKMLKLVDVGDIIGFKGTIRRTPRGELSIKATEYTVLTKALLPLPEKFHGLTDVETKYRQRYVDLIVNETTRDTFRKRSKIISKIREFLGKQGYLEVETPILQTVASGASARPFFTHHNALDMDMTLRIALELYLKRLIVGGVSEKVFEIGKCFRNEGIDTRHNPEFTMIELYQAFADYKDMMELTENMVAEVSKKVNGTTKVTYQGTEIDFMPPWRRITMVDAVKEYAGVDFNEFKSDADAQAVAKEKHLEFPKPLNTVTKGEVLNALYEEFCEQHMIQPTFIIDYPVEISPLTKKKRGNEMFTERFEGFVFGRELCNAYSELNDPIVQRERFAQQEKERELGDDEAYMIDEEFMGALETGMPPTGGLGIGIDRLIMFLTDSASIRDVILFPTMKPLNNN